MTPGPFEYHRPTSIEEALSLLQQFGDEGKILAGGHSLIPMMKLRLAQPAHLIDINAITALQKISEEDGEIVIGAAVTQAQVLASKLLAEKCPLLGAATEQIADPQVRNCGTVGGNCANGDPGNDYPAVMMALEASYTLGGAGAERQVAARDFYQGIYTTALAPDELLAAIRIPIPAPGTGQAYHKLKRKVGDFAIAAAAVCLSLEDQRCTAARVALTNVADTALLAAAAGESLVGTAVDDQAINAAAEQAMSGCDPAADMHGPAVYRTHMAGEMTRRAIRAALAQAGRTQA